MELVGIEQQGAGAVVVPRKGDWVVWRTNPWNGEYREGVIIDVSMDDFEGLTFSALRHYAGAYKDKVWGYVANIESINGEKVGK